MRRITRDQVVYSMDRRARPVAHGAPGGKVSGGAEDGFPYQIKGLGL